MARINIHALRFLFASEFFHRMQGVRSCNLGMEGIRTCNLGMLIAKLCAFLHAYAFLHVYFLWELHESRSCNLEILVFFLRLHFLGAARHRDVAKLCAVFALTFPWQYMTSRCDIAMSAARHRDVGHIHCIRIVKQRNSWTAFKKRFKKRFWHCTQKKHLALSLALNLVYTVLHCTH